MSDLIVDFPGERGNSSMGKSAGKTVQFATTNRLRVFEQSEEIDKSEIWYSKREFKAIVISTQQAVQAARKITKMPSSTPECIASKLAFGNDTIDVTGIENLLTQNIIIKRKALKTQCWNAVLEEQERQHHSGEFDPHKLASASRYYSKKAARRAHTIGMLQSMK